MGLRFPKLSGFYQKNQHWISIVSFVMGFGFDIVMLRRIDSPRTLIQQALYIILSAGLIAVELIELNSGPALVNKGLLARVWTYRPAFLHFLLGTLLNSYTIFYFKSASAATSFVYIALLVALLIFNEFRSHARSQVQLHVGLLSLCLISYLSALAPILLGFIGLAPFCYAVLACFVIFGVFLKWIARALLSSVTAGTQRARPRVLRMQVVYPFVLVQAVFVALYFAHVIPPVPLSVPYMGIYHDVHKGEGRYQLSYSRPFWNFWENGDQTFLARPGDSVFCFVQVFSPARFKDRLQIRWLNYTEKLGWQSSDAIPMPVLGGREEGYRAVIKKSNYSAGLWRVQVETMDNREIGRINLNIALDPATDERTFYTQTR